MLIAFDYSLSCPAMCISQAPGWSTSKFYYLTDVKKAIGTFLNGQIVGVEHKMWTSPEHRYQNISQFFMDMINKNVIDAYIPVFIEDYSFGSKGRVFHIAENTGLMKWKLWTDHHKITVVPPTVIKKFATGKGNADKQKMYETFVEQTGVHLQGKMFGWGTKLGSPVSDIVDAYFIAQYGHSLTK